MKMMGAVRPQVSLNDFVQSHAFLHDDSTPAAAFDEYSLHPVLLGAAVVVTNSARYCGPRYRKHLGALGAWPGQVIEPHEISLSPTSNMVNDARALDTLASAMKRGSLELSTFYHDTPHLPQLAALLEQRGVQAAVHPTPGLPSKCAARSDAMALLQQYGVPTLPGAACNQSQDIAHMAGRFGRVLIKEDGGVPILYNAGDFCPTPRAFPVYVEQFVQVLSSPNIQWMSGRGIGALVVCDQIVTDFKHVGNRAMDVHAVGEQLKAVETGLAAICAAFDFIGPIGLDAVIDDAGKLFIVDINARFNSCTYPQFFLRSLGMASAPFIYESVELRTQLLDDVFFDNRFIRFDHEGAGSLLVGPAAASVGGPTQSAFLLTAADDPEEAGEIHHKNSVTLKLWR